LAAGVGSVRARSASAAPRGGGRGAARETSVAVCWIEYRSAGLHGSAPVGTAFLLISEEFGGTEALRIGLMHEVAPLVSSSTGRWRSAARLPPGRRLGSGTLANARAWRAEAKPAATVYLQELLPTVFTGQDGAEGCAASSSAVPDASPAADLGAAASLTFCSARGGRLPTRGGGT